MEYDQNARHLIGQEHVEHLVRDYGSVPRDRRRRGRLDLRKLLGVAGQSSRAEPKAGSELTARAERRSLTGTRCPEGLRRAA